MKSLLTFSVIALMAVPVLASRGGREKVRPADVREKLEIINARVSAAGLGSGKVMSEKSRQELAEAAVRAEIPLDTADGRIFSKGFGEFAKALYAENKSTADGKAVEKPLLEVLLKFAEAKEKAKKSEATEQEAMIEMAERTVLEILNFIAQTRAKGEMTAETRDMLKEHALVLRLLTFHTEQMVGQNSGSIEKLGALINAINNNIKNKGLLELAVEEVKTVLLTAEALEQGERQAVLDWIALFRKACA